jgi:hypothetical protein
MTYLKEWSILKMRAVGEATRCKVKVKVESGKSPDNNRAADDRLSRKRKKKKTKRGISGRVPGTQGGGRREGRGCAARLCLRQMGPPGAGPFRPPPLSFLPLPSPRRGAHTDPISRELYRQISFAIRFSEMAKPSLRLCIRLMANGECKISNFHYSIIDYLLNG